MAFGMFNKRAMCLNSQQQAQVVMERRTQPIDRQTGLQARSPLWEMALDGPIYMNYPFETLTLPCKAFNRPGQYRIRTILKEIIKS